MPRVWNLRNGRVPGHAVIVDRYSKWGNPFPLSQFSRAEAIARYRERLLNSPKLMSELYELRGQDLACWCSPSPCHADVLLELANQ